MWKADYFTYNIGKQLICLHMTSTYYHTHFFSYKWAILLLNPCFLYLCFKLGTGMVWYAFLLTHDQGAKSHNTHTMCQYGIVSCPCTVLLLYCYSMLCLLWTSIVWYVNPCTRHKHPYVVSNKCARERSIHVK